MVVEDVAAVTEEAGGVLEDVLGFLGVLEDIGDKIVGTV